MDCPVCKVPLIAVERNKIEVDYCIVCSGIWFDEDEIALLSEALNLNLNINEFLNFNKVETEEKTYKCPRCRKKMEKVCFQGATEPIIDKCPDNHGLWFDKQELGNFMNNLLTNYSETELPVINFLGEIFYREKAETPSYTNSQSSE